MSRPIKNGLYYFPLDTNFFEDMKIRLVLAEFGPEAIAVLIKLYCEIYRNGYYLEISPDVILLLSKGINISTETFSRYLAAFLLRGLFDSSLFEAYSILTSRSIKFRYSKICSVSKRYNCISEIYNLILPENLEHEFDSLLPGSVPDATGQANPATQFPPEKQGFPPGKPGLNPVEPGLTPGRIPKVNKTNIMGSNDLFSNERDFFQSVSSKFNEYFNREPNETESTALVKLLTTDQRFKRETSWSIYLESIEVIALSGSAQRNTRYLIGIIKRKQNTLWSLHREQMASIQRKLEIESLPPGTEPIQLRELFNHFLTDPFPFDGS